jgi:PAS domain S-box-containing protein
MAGKRKQQLLMELAELKDRLEEAEQLINAIKAGEVDAFAINTDNKPDVYTLESGDYAYRVLVEEFGEGALTVTEEGLIVYTNSYFCELLGLPYDQVIGSNFFNLLHSGSVSSFQRLLAVSLTGKSKGEILLAIGDRTIPVYISMTSLQPKLPSLGIIITDLTRRKEIEEVIINYQKDLEFKNNALTRTNAELASFAYIASHDLQEPLRKIQTIADLILEKEAASFSPETKKYFERMILSSRRMQRLIIALLDYSRFALSEADFVQTDLDQLLTEVMDNLQQSMEETGTTVESSGLPSLKVIPYQFIQLFSNLLQNAIKYRKPDVAPRIVIGASKFPLAQLDLPASFRADYYWEIRIRDNGIGFEQQYSGRIFELFQRLSNRPEIEGTGIGLPICQKIVQNHEGYITAEAQTGIGATFVIYLPALPA